MIYFCADDYGLCESASEHIREGINKGILNKVSCFPNFDRVSFNQLCIDKNVRLSLHINLVEGKCLADPEEINLIADKSGSFKYTFGGLLKLSLFHRKKFEEQVYKEIRQQVLFWKSALGEDAEFCVDSHQHTHMIPSVFGALLKVLEDEKIKPRYMRIPAEPLSPFVKTPSLYFTYKPINVVKQWLLDFLWLFNRKKAERAKIPTAYFFGILFSGKMDEKRVKKVLPQYLRLSEKSGRDVEVLFHPGCADKDEIETNDKNIVFKDFYLSPDRKTEYDSVIKLSERSVK